jgi:hypothetical protein
LNQRTQAISPSSNEVFGDHVKSDRARSIEAHVAGTSAGCDGNRLIVGVRPMIAAII